MQAGVEKTSGGNGTATRMTGFKAIYANYLGYNYRNYCIFIRKNRTSLF